MTLLLALILLSPVPVSASGGIGTPLLVVRGTASHVGTQFGPRYLALPEHRWGRPGITVTICGPAACVTRTSTDAGPDKAMQRAGRVADLSWQDFKTVAGVREGEPDPGLVAVSIDYGDAGPRATLPATDTDSEPMLLGWCWT